MHRHCDPAYGDFHERWRGFVGRHRHGRGFRMFAAGFGDDGGLGGRNFRTGRKLGSGDLQLLLLSLLADQPRHGYELIKALEERSAGFYSPSPGMVYPALTYLEEVGHVTAKADGTRKRYSITDGGRAYLDDNRGLVDALLGQLAHIGSRMERVRRAFAGDDVEEDPRGTTSELRSARHDLRALLREKRNAPADEQRRIAAILRRAADEIRGQ
ncbi:helix-turn-helix transcriptional regulator [Vineibacter terrae]|uniref:Helix-turn-helix transcriptional regulator n=1 Tax=Vineibacter terrae TaxID=2586908 RepID=A0A5C8PKM9_9HYPH|nr:PadR family transcriptional regulator [Vineibacter terrae]TXL74111.1 helix-turn-helix transcriptional regulator [Vineibacter terrae]